ncbi:PREDICTED: uncharacterized protein LOC104540619 [Mesitornis unicolor]|uniref:uncharacterized protein LOC104540619 n=1 Tax=Mesitornis unicolor TaxID=54374 RepID=UPI0005284EA5|nr:PREDICTED: uncharacterized protein LOC104540619 [Mesitornis unicolor]
MHYYGERYKQLYLPGSGYSTESLQQCVPQPDGCSTTCHPVSIIKSPMPTWQNYMQPFTYVCPQPSVTQAPLLACQPYVQQRVLLYPESCETACLLPCRKPSLKLSPMQDFQPCQPSRLEKKRVAKSLPPCAPRCPEPGKLRFPPCGIKYSSSCKDECRSHRIAKCSSQRCGAELRSSQGMNGRYSAPLQGVTECPPQQCVTQSFLQEYVGTFPHQRCMKGYPTQEYCETKCPPQPRVPKCPPGQGVKECSLEQRTVKYSLPQKGAKLKSASTQHLSKSKCLYPCATQCSSQVHHFSQMSFGGDAGRCFYPCDVRCSEPFATSCNEPCVVSCGASRVIIYPPPVVVTFPGPILTTCPQETVVGSSEVLEGSSPAPPTSLRAEILRPEPPAERFAPKYVPECAPRSSYVFASRWMHPCSRPGYRRSETSESEREEHAPEEEMPKAEDTATENEDEETSEE